MYRQLGSLPLQENQDSRAHAGYHRARGAIAQLEERLDRTQEVVGSSPTSSTRRTSRGSPTGTAHCLRALTRVASWVTFALLAEVPSRTRQTTRPTSRVRPR